MPFCPKCGTEYTEGTKYCSDCEVKLVDQPPAVPADEETEYEDWVKLARLTSPEYASMLEEELRAKDIPVIIRPEVGHFGNIGTLGPSSFVPVGGGYLVLVPEEFVERVDLEATALLGDVWKEAKLVDIEGA
jgi:hypothetical protein